MTEHVSYTKAEYADLARFQTGTHDEGHLLRGNFDVLPAPEFHAQAEGVLRGMERTVMHDVIPNLEHFTGKWHPLGFMVWHLGVNDHGESLRLHIWPEGERKYNRGPHIHNHAWHLSSLVLAGDYTDTLFNLDETGGPVTEENRQKYGLLRQFQLGYTEDGRDAMVTDGSCAWANPIEKRIAHKGEVHNIVDGVFHVPTIGEDRTAATLVLDSPELGYKTTVLIDAPTDPLQDPRILVTPEEAQAAKKLILK